MSIGSLVGSIPTNQSLEDGIELCIFFRFFRCCVFKNPHQELVKFTTNSGLYLVGFETLENQQALLNKICAGSTDQSLIQIGIVAFTRKSVGKYRCGEVDMRCESVQ